MLESLGLADHQHMLEVNLFGVRRWRRHFGCLRLNAGALKGDCQTKQDEPNTAGIPGKSQLISFSALNIRLSAKYFASRSELVCGLSVFPRLRPALRGDGRFHAQPRGYFLPGENSIGHWPKDAMLATRVGPAEFRGEPFDGAVSRIAGQEFSRTKTITVSAQAVYSPLPRPELRSG